MQDKEKEREFFDRIAVNERRFEYFSRHAFEKIFAEFSSFCRPGKDSSIADFGCGSGEFTKKLAEISRNVTAFDISPECIKIAKEEVKGATFRVADAENTPFGPDSFDIVTCISLLHHFSDLTGVLNEAQRVLKPGGKLFAVDSNKRNPILWLYRCSESPFYSSRGISPNERLLTAQELTRKLHEAGFEARVLAIAPLYYSKARSLPKICVHANNLFEFFLSLSPIAYERFGSFLFTYAEKK
ncbi:MAG: methyltransferase domain-containing protein [Candidatus Diapherotrites archaeon]